MINLNPETLVAAIIGINFFSVGLYAILIRQNRSQATTIFLLVFCISLALSQLYDVLMFNGIYGSYLRFLDELSLLLAFISLYFYVLSLTQNPFRFQRKHALHVISILVFLIIWVFPIPGLEQYHDSKPLRLLYAFYNHLQGIAYVLLINNLIRKHQRILPDFSSTALENNLSWVRIMVVILVVLVFLWTMSGFINDDFNLNGYALLIFSYWLGYHMIAQKSIYTGAAPGAQLAELQVEKRYKTSTLSASEKSEMAGHIRHFMETEKPYLNNELTLSSLADRLKMKPIHLSQVLNEMFNENFYTFVNRYRVDESKNLLNDPRYSHYNILGIALEAGFNSKTTFNKTFKENTGISPSQFQRSIRTS